MAEAQLPANTALESQPVATAVACTQGSVPARSSQGKDRRKHGEAGEELERVEDKTLCGDQFKRRLEKERHGCSQHLCRLFSPLSG